MFIESIILQYFLVGGGVERPLGGNFQDSNSVTNQTGKTNTEGYGLTIFFFLKTPYIFVPMSSAALCLQV